MTDTGYDHSYRDNGHGQAEHSPHCRCIKQHKQTRPTQPEVNDGASVGHVHDADTAYDGTCKDCLPGESHPMRIRACT